MRFKNPSDGKIIDAPKAGIAALRALGWEELDPPAAPPADKADADGEADEQDTTGGEDGEAKAKPAPKRGNRRTVPKPGDDD